MDPISKIELDNFSERAAMGRRGTARQFASPSAKAATNAATTCYRLPVTSIRLAARAASRRRIPALRTLERLPPTGGNQ